LDVFLLHARARVLCAMYFLFSLTPVRGGGFGFACASGVPAAYATAGLMCDIFLIFIDPCAGRRFWVCLRLGVPAAYATAGLMCDVFFIFIDPCAGRHVLLLLRQKK
jgi:hypothetical protein